MTGSVTLDVMSLTRSFCCRLTKRRPLTMMVMLLLYFWILLFVSSDSLSSSFTIIAPTAVRTRGLDRGTGALGARTNGGDDDAVNNLSENERQLERREWFQQAGIMLSSISSSLFLTESSEEHNMIAHAAADGLGSSPEHPIVVLGAGGKTGKLCTQILAKKGLYCRAVTRSGRKVLDDASHFITYAAGDVTNYESTRAAVQGADGVIFVASASGKKKGGDPAHVDYLGAYHTGKACLEEGRVPKLVLVSAGTTTRPDSAGYVALNVLTKFLIGENIMGYKSAGEQAIRDAYNAATASAAGQGYTIIRPGGLSDEQAAGASNIHLSQGDVLSSEISRSDVAEVAVACILKGKATESCTFELNNIKGIYKAMGNLPDLPPELVHAGAPSYDALLDGLKTDSEMLQSYPDIVSTFAGGSTVLPLDKIN